jgi:maleate isomerase
MTIAAEILPLETEKVSVAYALDRGSARYRIGLIALSTDEATEYDFHRMLPAEEVMFFTSRVITVNPVTMENLRSMGPRLAAAAGQILPDQGLDVIAYSCTSGTVAMGYDGVAAQIREGRPGVPVVTPITAAVKGFRKLGIDRISLLTPYIDSVNQPMRRFLEDQGIAVAKIASFCLESDVDMARLPPEAIRAAALETYRADAQALFISCTAIRAAEVVADLEAELGVPVLSSIQCLFWDALRQTGYGAPLEGHGSLMRL